MTDVELQLNAWTDNKGASVFAVQGEQESRTLHVTLIDRDGESEPYSSAPKEPRYIDLTGYTARLYVVKSDSTKVYFPGEITDAENGKVDFTLTGQCVAAPGKAECTIVLTKEDVELKVVGIVLDVRENDLEGSIESSDEWVELDVMLTKAQEAIDACETATDAANSAASSVTSKITEMDQLKGELQTAEAARVKAEEGRVSAESTRVSQESARQSAEQQRQTDSAAAVSAANTAAGSANTAADRANKAAEAIEGTDVGDLAVRVDTLEGEMDTAQQDINNLKGNISLDPIPMESGVNGVCFLLRVAEYNKVIIDLMEKPDDGLLVTLPVQAPYGIMITGSMVPTAAMDTNNMYALGLDVSGEVSGIFGSTFDYNEEMPLHIEFGYIG